MKNTCHWSMMVTLSGVPQQWIEALDILTRRRACSPEEFKPPAVSGLFVNKPVPWCNSYVTQYLRTCRGPTRVWIKRYCYCWGELQICRSRVDEVRSSYTCWHTQLSSLLHRVVSQYQRSIRSSCFDIAELGQALNSCDTWLITSDDSLHWWVGEGCGRSKLIRWYEFNFQR